MTFLDDAAWPARYRLDDSERNVLSAVMSGRSLEDVLSLAGGPSAVDALLARGLLTGRIRGGARS